jgi:peptidoglycan/xylan/chitin deacetylase (PgdA/CDA1 family)
MIWTGGWLVWLTLMAGGGLEYRESGIQPESGFVWPEGRRAALSLTFDDGRPSQLDHGLPILDRYGVKATFYVNPEPVRGRVEEWREALAQGHEIGNHTRRHPCTGNFRWARSTALEDYTLETIAAEIDEGAREIESLVGRYPKTFAYPCGQKFVGRGREARSYIPVVAERYLAGRGWLDEGANDPVFCDPANLLGRELDGLDFEQARGLVDQAIQEGSWLILCGHDIGPGGRQTVRTDTLDALCRYVARPESGIWVDTVERIATYVASARRPDSSR